MNGRESRGYRMIARFSRHKVESSFGTARIVTEKTKADFVIANLELEIVAHLKDILTIVPPPPDIYTRIKERIIAGFSAYSKSRIRQLLQVEVLSEGKPSVFLNRVRSLDDDSCGDEIIKSVFLEQLPTQVRAILAMLNVDNLQALAQIADKFTDAAGPTGFQVSAVKDVSGTFKTSVGVPSSKSDDLIAKIDCLPAQLDKLTERFNQSSTNSTRNRSRSQSRNRNRPNPSQNGDSKELCFYYHRKFGKKAKRCTAPYSWKPETSTEN